MVHSPAASTGGARALPKPRLMTSHLAAAPLGCQGRLALDVEKRHAVAGPPALDTDASNMGHAIILPTSRLGSPGKMHRLHVHSSVAQCDHCAFCLDIALDAIPGSADPSTLACPPPALALPHYHVQARLLPAMHEGAGGTG